MALADCAGRCTLRHLGNFAGSNGLRLQGSGCVFGGVTGDSRGVAATGDTRRVFGTATAGCDASGEANTRSYTGNCNFVVVSRGSVTSPTLGARDRGWRRDGGGHGSRTTMLARALIKGVVQSEHTLLQKKKKSLLALSQTIIFDDR